MKTKSLLFMFICLVLNTHLAFAEAGESDIDSITVSSEPSAQSVGGTSDVTALEIWEAQTSSVEELNVVGFTEALSAGTLSIGICCTPPACPSGYTDQGVNCTLNGLNYECTRTCYRAPGCGSWGSWQEETQSYMVGVGDDLPGNLYAASLYTSSDKCYEYTSKIRLWVSDFDPGGILHFDTESYELFTEWKGGGGTWGCSQSQQTSFTLASASTNNYGRGDGGGIWGRGGFEPYKSGGCSGGEAYGLEGTITAYLVYRTAPWIPAGYANQTCSGSIACTSDSHCGTDGWVGSPFCSSDDVYQNYRQYDCHNPGECDAYCDHTDTLMIKEDCGTDSCGSWGSNYCMNDDVYHSRTCYDRGCSGGSCFENSSQEEEMVQECGTDSCDSWGSNYCKNGDVYHSRPCYDRGCSGGSCFEDPFQEEAMVEACDNGCSNGQCIGCSDECSSGQTRCNGNYLQTCGDYDSDSCLEWPSSTSGSGNDDCSDCSCSCGGYDLEESVANGNCNDGKDNDCDGFTDSSDPGCGDYTTGWNLMNFDLHNSNLYPYPSEVRVQNVPFKEKWTGSGTTMKTGDVDGDGYLELVTSDSSNLYVYDGNGVIEWQMATAASLNALADVTDDGRPEILTSIKDGATGRIEAYDGSGPASPVKTFTTSVDLDYGGVTARGVTDLDEDGVNELIATKGAAWVQGRGVVVFDCSTTNELWYYDVGPFVPYPAIGDVVGLLTDKEILHGSSGPANGVTGADGSNDSSCYAFLLDATGSSLWRKQFEGSGFVNASAGLCDVDGDARLDIVATSFSHGTSFWDGSLGRVYILDPTTGEPISGYEHNFSTAVTLGGFADLDANGTPEILINKKDGSIQAGSILALSPISGLPVVKEFSVSGSALDILFINDLNGDDKLEVIAKGTPVDGSDHTLYVLDNELNFLWSIVPGGSIQAIVSDLDEDGMNEIILSSGGSVYIFEGNECYEMSGDFDDDCDVDYVDLSSLVENWLWTGTPGGIDEDIAPQPDGDGMVNFLDFALFAEDWLVGFVPTPPEPEKFYELTLDTNPSWTTEGLWAFGQPTGGGGAYGWPDPTTGYTGVNVYGYNLAGDYENSLSETNLTSTAIDCSGQFNVHLKFWRWLGVEQPAYDHAYIQISNNGTDWVVVWQNTSEVADLTWKQVDINISAVADNQAAVYLRWTMGSTDSSWTYCGWNIDDIELWGTP